MKNFLTKIQIKFSFIRSARLFLFIVTLSGVQAQLSLASPCNKIFSTFSADLKAPHARKTVDALWQKYFQNRSIENRNALVEFYMPLVHHFIGPIARRIQAGLERVDLVQVGTLGLIRAIERYDPSASTTFEHFAGFRIQGEALDFFRDIDNLSRSDRTRLKRLQRVQQSFYQENGRPASDEELQNLLSQADLSDFEVTKTLEAERLGGTFSLDEGLETRAENQNRRSEAALKDKNSQEAMKRLDQIEFWKNFFTRRGFDERTAQIIFDYFFEGKTQKEISEQQIPPMSASNVSLILTRALNELKALDEKKLEELKEILAR